MKPARRSIAYCMSSKPNTVSEDKFLGTDTRRVRWKDDSFNRFKNGLAIPKDERTRWV
jgi:hypothetical protein